MNIKECSLVVRLPVGHNIHFTTMAATMHVVNRRMNTRCRYMIAAELSGYETFNELTQYFIAQPKEQKEKVSRVSVAKGRGLMRKV